MAEMEQVRLELLFPRSPWEWKDRLLNILEQFSLFSPTHWGESDHLRHPYHREELVLFVDEARQGETPPVPSLRRTQHPRYVATWNTSTRVPGWLFVESQMRLRAEDPALLFELSQVLASTLPVEYGLVDIQFRNLPTELEMKRGALQHPQAYARYGPDTLHARTFFGPRLIRLMGGAPVLHASGGAVHHYVNGVIALDLLGTPWTAEPSQLKQRQSEVLDKLRPTGIFAQQEGSLTRPGQRWEPPASGQTE